MKKELIIGYFAQSLGIISNLVILPFILNSLGPQIFGIYSFFVVLSGLVNYIDVGMSSSMLRLTKQFTSGTVDREQFANTNNTFHSILLILDLLFILVLILFKNRIIQNWELNENESLVFTFILLAASLKFLQTLYRGTLNGADKVSTLHIFSICSILLRTFILAIIIYFYRISALEIFQYITLVSFVELVCINILNGKYIPVLKGLPYTNKIEIERIKDNFQFIGSITMGSLVWTLVTQLDKFILGILIDIQEFGLNQAGITLASSILLIIAPISKSLIPRFVEYYELREFNKLIDKYLSLASLLIAIGTYAFVTFLLFGKYLLKLWLNLNPNNTLDEVYNTLILFSFGNAIALFGSASYYLQYSCGDLRYYRQSNIIYVVIFIFVTLPAIYMFGFLGAGVTWIISNVIILILINSRINNHFNETLNYRFWKMLLTTVIQISISALIIYSIIDLISWTTGLKFGLFVSISIINFYLINRKNLYNLLK